MEDGDFKDAVEFFGKLVDPTGVAVIVLGILAATWLFAVHLAKSDDRDGACRRYRRGIGRVILLGLELLVAADIIRTVGVSPTGLRSYIARGVGSARAADDLTDH